jgi:drug/metabolite transporter (DMT)-like permease
MNEVYLPILLVILANLLFSSASVGFTHYTRKFGPIWMASVKVFIAAIFISLVFGYQLSEYSWDIKNIQKIYTDYSYVLFLFIISGVIGLGIGDIFLLNAYRNIGTSRSLILFGTQPIMIGLFGYLFLDQKLSIYRIISIFFMILCLINFLWEALKANKKSWTLIGMFYAFMAVMLDAIGLTLTRLAYDISPNMDSIEANFFRFMGALFFYLIIIKLFFKVNIKSNWNLLNIKNKTLLFLYCFLGTFLSLILYLKAVKMSPLASLTSISITGPVFATLIESVVEKKKPSKSLIISLILFAIGLIVLNFDK